MTYCIFLKVKYIINNIKFDDKNVEKIILIDI